MVDPNLRSSFTVTVSPRATRFSFTLSKLLQSQRVEDYIRNFGTPLHYTRRRWFPILIPLELQVYNLKKSFF